MVMGVQRSGTTVLFHSMAHDQSLTPHNESVDSAVYYRYRLRPLAEIGRVLDAARGAVLLKPLSETFDRSLEELAAEYKDYHLRIVWIYRDPVNVLYSMHRHGWISRSHVDHPSHISEWVRRNHLALQFQQRHPAQIALVRYEDCHADPMVFRQVAAWLGLEGQSLFRQDSAQGRLRLPLAVQRNIDAAAGPTLNDLDVARTFRARPLHRAKLNTTKFMARFSNKLRRVAGRARPKPTLEWDPAVCLARPAPPDQVEGLRFLLDVRKLNSDLRESGPFRLKARGDPSCPLYVQSLNGKHALFFPKVKATARREGTPGILHFGAREAWSFFLEGGAISVFALFKPIVPNDQHRTVILRIGPLHGPPAFILEWDRQLKAPKAIFFGPQTAHGSVVAAAPQTHPHREWRLVHFQKEGTCGAQLSLAVNGFAGQSITSTASPGGAPLRGPDCTLHLGGDEAQRDALFFGAIAELIVFDRALETTECRGVVRFLKDKYCF